MSGACPSCGSAESQSLPDPGARCMVSDGRILDEPLRRVACDRCGLAWRVAGADAASGGYCAGYSLYAHAPGQPFERVRQDEYAAWIAAAVERAPQRVLDVGCGNGSLLLELRSRWPGSELAGCDPSAASVAHACAAGIQAWQGAAERITPAPAADLVVSVNVLEHSTDPRAFAAGLRRAVAHGGTVLVICPDGSRPGVELLFADHRWSMTPPHVATILRDAGLRAIRATAAPASLGTFQMIVARPGAGDASAMRTPDPRGLNRGRSALLESWRRLDRALADRLPEQVVCFGAGEAAALLRAYAPESWSRVAACTTDVVIASSFGAVPLVALDAVPRGAEMLVAVRADRQAQVAERLRGRFARVVTWYDLVGEIW